MTSQELIEKFKFPLENFSSPIAYSSDVGFSVIQEHGNNRASIYHIVIDDKETNPIKKIRSGVNYGEKTDSGIRLGIDNNLFNPIDLDFSNEFTYNIQTNKFYFKDKEIEANDILLKTEKVHIRPTKLIWGLPLRLKLWFWRKAIPFVIKAIDLILIGILWVISGERIKDDIWKRLLWKHHENEKGNIKEIEFEKAETIDFFGYKAKRWSVVFYSLIHLIFFYFYNKLGFNFSDKVLSNSLLVICYIIVTFFVTESLIPKILKSLIKLTPKIFGYISFKRLKV